MSQSVTFSSSDVFAASEKSGADTAANWAVSCMLAEALEGVSTGSLHAGFGPLRGARVSLGGQRIGFRWDFVEGGTSRGKIVADVGFEYNGARSRLEGTVKLGERVGSHTLFRTNHGDDSSPWDVFLIAFSGREDVFTREGLVEFAAMWFSAIMGADSLRAKRGGRLGGAIGRCLDGAFELAGQPLAA